MTRSRLALSAVGALAAVSLTACGGSSAPTDASVEDFCKAQMSIFEDVDIDMSDPEATPTGEEIADALHGWADRISEVGTPEDIPDDARSGFEAIIDQVNDLDADDIDPEDPSGFADDLSDEAEEEVDDYSDYVSEQCGEPELPEVPELPTE